MKKKVVALIVGLFIMCGGFVAVVEILKEKQTINPEQKQDVEENAYMTEEVLAGREALEKLQVKEIPYIAFRYDYDNEKAEYNEIYYVYDEEIIEKVVSQIEESEFQVAVKADSTEYETGHGCEVWLGIGGKINLLYLVTPTKFDMEHCRFALTKVADYIGIEGNQDFDKFDREYFQGFFVKDSLQDLLLQILQEKICEIPLQEARAFVKNEEEIDRGDFQQYLHIYVERREFLNDTLGAACMKYQLADDEGYLYVYDSLATDADREVLLVEWYSKEGILQETLYESAKLKGN